MPYKERKGIEWNFAYVRPRIRRRSCKPSNVHPRFILWVQQCVPPTRRCCAHCHRFALF